MRRLSEAELLIAGIEELTVWLDSVGHGEGEFCRQLLTVQRNLRVKTATAEEYQAKLAIATRSLHNLQVVAPKELRAPVSEKISALIIFAFRTQAQVN